MAKVFEISEKDLARRFREIEMKRPEALVRGIISAGLLGAEVVAAAAPKDTGMTKKSTRFVTQSTGGYILTDAPHAGVVEMGSRPHTPPLQPLIDWARRHGATDDADAHRMAFGVQRKIAREGTRPTYFTRKCLPKLRKILAAEVKREMDAASDR